MRILVAAVKLMDKFVWFHDMPSIYGVGTRTLKFKSFLFDHSLYTLRYAMLPGVAFLFLFLFFFVSVFVFVLNNEL